MCLRSVNIDEARLLRISPSFKDVRVIDRWLAVVINDAIKDMEQNRRVDLTAVEKEPQEEEDTPAETSRKYSFDRDMTVEELYAAIVEDAKAIYAE